MDRVETLRSRLQAVPAPLARIARAAGVKESWLRMFARGEIPDPGVRKVDAVERVLANVEAGIVLDDPAEKHVA